MKKAYVSPEVVEINMNELAVLLRCSCTADDDNPYRT